MTKPVSKPRKGAMKVALHALRPEIEAGLAARKPIIMIYDELKDRLPCGYEWFRHFVAREITGTVGSRGGRAGAPGAVQPRSAVPDQTTTPKSSSPETKPIPERNRPSESSEYKPRKFTDFGNLESNLDRWYGPADDEGK